MLGLLVIYFIGKAFYKLAGQHNRNEWGYAILGVVAYYVSAFIGGIILVIAYELLEMGNIDEVSDQVIGLLALPFGLLGCWGTYKLLENRFEGSPFESDPDILDDEFTM